MKIVKFTIENFRGYSSPISIDFDNITTFVGPNDIGKSTILEALDLFFNEGIKSIVKIDASDLNIHYNSSETILTVSFSDVQDDIVIDSTNITKLSEEYLLDSNGFLTVKKSFNPTKTKPSVFLIANHPTNDKCNDLHSLKISDLKKRVDELGLDCNRSICAEMRRAIWSNYSSDLNLQETCLDVTKTGDLKSIWDKLNTFLPQYSLFQSDRKNTDSDSEVQDPLKEAVKLIMRDVEIQSKLKEVADKVKQKLNEVSTATLDKLREMNSDLANSLHPNIPSSETLKWTDVFKNLSISGDEDIPINKRGSGIRRLILLNFFRAEAERKMRESNIYAIEEPETSQHFIHQKKLIEALTKMSEQPNCQIILTTHSAEIVKRLQFPELRLIQRIDDTIVIEKPDKPVLKMRLPDNSLNEVNYLAFGCLSTEYHDELYGYLQNKAIMDDPANREEKYFDRWLRAKISPSELLLQNWIRTKKDGTTSDGDVPIQIYIRNYIHHSENTHNLQYSEEELKKSIEQMRDIAATV